MKFFKFFAAIVWLLAGLAEAGVREKVDGDPFGVNTDPNVGGPESVEAGEPVGTGASPPKGAPVFDESEVHERDAACSLLEKRYSRGFLAPAERSEYCAHKCTFLRVKCYDYVVEDTRLRDFTEAWMKYANRVVFDEFLNDEEHSDTRDSGLLYDETTVAVWMTILWRILWLVLGMVPVLLNQWKYFSFWPAVGVIIFIFLSSVFGPCSWAIAAHNAVMCILCLLSPSGSPFLVESVWTIVGMFIPIISIFLTDPIVHVGICVATVVGFGAYAKQVFFKKRRSTDAAVLVMAVQIWVLSDELAFAKDAFSESSLGGAALDMAFSCIYPTGNHNTFAENAGRKAGRFLSHIFGSTYDVRLFLLLTQLQMMAFAGFRACIGAYYIHVLRYSLDWSTIPAGFWVYVTDAFGPFICAWRIIFNLESINSRRVTYAIVGVWFFVMEFNNAFGFLVIRIVCSLLDKSLIQSRYGQMVHYLEFPMDMRQVAFPHHDAMPWFCLNELMNVGRFTGRLKVIKDHCTIGGMGCALVSGGRSMLYSVRHVVNGAKSVHFLNHDYASPDFRSLTKGVDCMMAMKADFDDAPRVELLTPPEVAEIKHLLFLNRNDSDENFITLVPKWSFDRNNMLRASVNLMKGDSGGPVFAILSTGVLRICGVVSSGNPRDGGGNLVSFCYHGGEMSGDSSDEDSNPLSNVSSFNRVRQVKFASDDPDARRYAVADELKAFLVNHAEEIREMGTWPVKIGIGDMDLSIDPDEVVDRLLGSLEQQRRDDGDRDNPGAKDTRRARKDKAARKRMVNASRLLFEKLKHVYSKRDAETLFLTFMEGNVPDIPPRMFLTGGSKGSWFFADDLPDVDWT